MKDRHFFSFSLSFILSMFILIMVADYFDYLVQRAYWSKPEKTIEQNIPLKLSERGMFLPDRDKTPGDTLLVSLDTICTIGYTKETRDVSSSKKRVVFELYNKIPSSDRFEVDHLIPLELGGSNSIRNLWPESYTTTPWNAYRKDELENKLHELVCEKKISLETAQKEIATDWVAAYLKYIELPKQGK